MPSNIMLIDLSSIDIKKTLMRCALILVLGSFVLFLLVKFRIWTIIAPADKIFVVLIFIILFSTIGVHPKRTKNK
jgi:hypothetical protein